MLDFHDGAPVRGTLACRAWQLREDAVSHCSMRHASWVDAHNLAGVQEIAKKGKHECVSSPENVCTQHCAPTLHRTQHNRDPQRNHAISSQSARYCLRELLLMNGQTRNRIIVKCTRALVIGKTSRNESRPKTR